MQPLIQPLNEADNLSNEGKYGAFLLKILGIVEWQEYDEKNESNRYLTLKEINLDTTAA